MVFSGCCIIGSWSVLWCLVAATATKIAQMPEQINIPNSDNGQITTIFQISNLNKWILSDADCHPYPHDPMSAQILPKINGSHFIIFLLHWTSALTRIELHSRRLENSNNMKLKISWGWEWDSKCPALMCLPLSLTKESPRGFLNFISGRTHWHLHKNSLCWACAAGRVTKYMRSRSWRQELTIENG